MRQVSENEVIVELWRATAGKGNAAKWAENRKLSHNFVSMMKNGKLPITFRVASELGFFCQKTDDGLAFFKANRRSRCMIAGCGKDVEARGYCVKHYRRHRRHGDAHTVKKSPGSAPKQVDK